MKKIFTKEQEKFILDNYQTMKYKNIAKQLGDFTATQVTGWLCHNKENHKNTSIFSQQDIDFMLQNYKTMTYNQIAECLGYTERQIRGKINNMNLKKISTFNDRYFENIDTSEKAYWLGYIYADGWVTLGKHPHLGMSLQATDKNVLLELDKAINGNHKLSYRKRIKDINGKGKLSYCESYQLRIYSEQMVKDLISHNIELNKTYKHNFPKVDSIFFYDFLRGYIDGDGSIYIDKKNILRVTITSYSKEILEYIQTELQKDKILTSIYKENRIFNNNKTSIYRFHCFQKESTKNLLNKLYKDDNCQKLDRKYKVYKSFNDGSPC